MASDIQSVKTTRKRGGDKLGGIHLALLVLSTLLLTVSAVLFVAHWNVAGVVALVLALALRFVDSRL